MSYPIRYRNVARLDTCYALCNPTGRWFKFRRVKYDIARTRRKINRAELPA